VKEEKLNDNKVNMDELAERLKANQ